MKKILASVAIIVIAVGAGVAIRNHARRAVSPAPVPTASAQPGLITYRGQDGTDALTLLQAKHQVDIKQYSFGPLVTGIDGLENTDAKSWIFYVNGQSASVGAKDYLTKSTDTIEWRYEAFTP